MKKILLSILAFSLTLVVVAEKPINKPVEIIKCDDFTIWDFYVPPLPSGYHPKETPAIYEEFRSIQEQMDRVRIQVKALVIDESLGRYMVTAYCNGPCCCGIYANGKTASGTECHRASDFNRRTEPTTCAIDRRYHSFGDLIYIPSEDRVYVAEDTGSGVKGRWCDTYQDSHSSVVSYNTRKEELFSCHYVYYLVPANDYDVHKYLNWIDDIKERNI